MMKHVGVAAGTGDRKTSDAADIIAQLNTTAANIPRMPDIEASLAKTAARKRKAAAPPISPRR